MNIELTAQEYIIRISKSVFNAEEIDRLTTEIRLKEIASQLGGTDQEATHLAEEINTNWWNLNRNRFIK